MSLKSPLQKLVATRAPVHHRYNACVESQWHTPSRAARHPRVAAAATPCCPSQSRSEPACTAGSSCKAHPRHAKVHLKWPQCPGPSQHKAVRHARSSHHTKPAQHPHSHQHTARRKHNQHGCVRSDVVVGLGLLPTRLVASLGLGRLERLLNVRRQLIHQGPLGLSKPLLQRIHDTDTQACWIRCKQRHDAPSCHHTSRYTPQPEGSQIIHLHHGEVAPGQATRLS